MEGLVDDLGVDKDTNNVGNRKYGLLLLLLAKVKCVAAILMPDSRVFDCLGVGRLHNPSCWKLIGCSKN